MSKFSALANAGCWRCRAPVPTKASILCPVCHAREVAQVHAHDTPTADELGLLGQQGDYPAWLCEGMRGKSRRVVRKSVP